MSALLQAIASPPSSEEFAPTSRVGGLRRRSVGLPGTFAQSIAAVAPSASAMTMPAIAAQAAGQGTVWAVAVAVGLCLLVASCVNQFTRRMSATGSLYTFVARALGPVPGRVAGVMILIGYGSVAALSAAGAANSLIALGSRFQPRLLAIPLLPVAVAISGLVLVLLILAAGIRVSTGITLVVESVSIALVLFLLAGLVIVSSHQSTAPAPMPLPDLSGLGAGAVLAVPAMVGFESASTLGAESTRPLRHVPKVILITVVASGALYLVSTAGETIGFASVGQRLATSTDPAQDLAGISGMPVVGLLLEASIAASFFGCAIANVTAVVRVLYTMALDGDAPMTIARLAPRRRTPVVAAVLVSSVIVVVLLVPLVSGYSLTGTMQLLLLPASTGFMVAYLLLAAATPSFLRHVGEPSTRATVIAVVTAALLGVALVSYLTGQLSRAGWPATAVLLVVLGLASGLLLLQSRRSGRSRPGTAYDQPTADEVLGG